MKVKTSLCARAYVQTPLASSLHSLISGQKNELMSLGAFGPGIIVIGMMLSMCIHSEGGRLKLIAMIGQQVADLPCTWQNTCKLSIRRPNTTSLGSPKYLWEQLTPSML